MFAIFLYADLIESFDISVQLRGMLLRGECAQDSGDGVRQQPGRGEQVLGGVCQQQEESCSSLETESGQR